MRLYSAAPLRQDTQLSHYPLRSPTHAAIINATFGHKRRAMPKPCSERDRLRDAYYQATLEASALTGVLQSASFGPEFSAALDKAEIARSA
jgi:hypothetical protein